MPKKAETPSEVALEIVARLLVQYFEGGTRLTYRTTVDGYEFLWGGFGKLSIRHIRGQSQYKFHFAPALHKEIAQTDILSREYAMEYDEPKPRLGDASGELKPTDALAKLAASIFNEVTAKEIELRYQRVRGRCCFTMTDLFTLDFYEGKYKLAVDAMLQARFIECGVLGSYYRSSLT